ncbi:MAG: glycosyltransferase involved in cell wall biosynthesis [Bacteroidia bacterium]|jgi:glycosyltransferase involved in cell wall biosynthesis
MIFYGMRNEQTISILLPFKNETRYLEECLTSIVNQSFLRWELIAIDDESTDDSFEIATRFANLDQRIKVYKNLGSGVIDALKMAHHKSTGAWLSRMDADDIKTPNNLEQLMAIKGKGVLGIGLVKYFREDGLSEGYARYEVWINEVTKAERTWAEVYKECVVPSPCWVAHYADFERVGGFDSIYYPEDYDLCFRFYKGELKVRSTADVIHLWRDHAIRTTRVSEHYLDNRFTALKVKYFAEIDFNSASELVLWGAGGRAKTIAKYLNEHKLPFRWITNNSKKMGRDIYGVILESSDDFCFINKQCIVGVGDLLGQEEIRNQLGENTGQVFWFC